MGSTLTLTCTAPVQIFSENYFAFFDLFLLSNDPFNTNKRVFYSMGDNTRSRRGKRAQKHQEQKQKDLLAFSDNNSGSSSASESEKNASKPKNYAYGGPASKRTKTALDNIMDTEDNFASTSPSNPLEKQKENAKDPENSAAAKDQPQIHRETNTTSNSGNQNAASTTNPDSSSSTPKSLQTLFIVTKKLTTT